MSQEFDRLLSKHKDAVYRQLFRMCGNHDDAEDVLVQSLLSAYRAIDSLRDEEHFQAWLVQIGRRTCGRLKKRDNARPVVGLDDLIERGLTLPNAPSPEDEAVDAELKRCVQNALEEVPPEYKEIYVLRDIEGLTGEETAARLGITLPAMKSRLHRARSLIREKIDALLTPDS